MSAVERGSWGFRVLGVVHSLLQRLVPPAPDRVVFTSIPDHSDSSFAVYRHLLRTRTNLRITWIVVDMTASSRIEREFAAITTPLGDGHGHRLDIRSRHSWRGYLAYLRARTVFHTHGVFAFARTDHRRHIVSLWHGMPIKAIGRLNVVTTGETLSHGTTHLATSEMFRYIIAAAFGVDPSTVLLATLPRTDALLAEEPAGPGASEVQERLGLPSGRPVIFWMPTYRTQANAQFVLEANRRSVDGGARTFLDDVPEELLVALDRACGAHGCHVVVKLHPLDALNHERRDLHLDHVTVLTSEEFLDSGLQLYDVLAHCHGILSDLSSVLIDFVPTGRPIGLIGMPFDRYERNLLLPLELFTSNPRFDHLVDPDDVEQFVRAVSTGVRRPADSFTSLLHADDLGPGCEAVLRDARL